MIYCHLTMQENKDHSIVQNIILTNQLYVVPLRSVRDDGICSCGKEDCSSPGKHPLHSFNWKIIASNNPTKIVDWFSISHKINFGLATGRLSKITGKYLVVIDVDKPDHPFVKTLPDTFSYKTGSGGFHFWFWSKYPIKNSVSLLADKVDVRGTDGYVVIPPSKHRKGIYTQINNVPIEDLPTALLNVLFSKPQPRVVKTKTSSNKALNKNSVWIKESVPVIRDIMQTQLVPDGVRNIVMHRLLSSDRAKGCLRSELELNARNYVKRFEKPETFKSDIPLIIDSVMKYPAYNNSHEKVNEFYVSWLQKNKKTKLTQAEIKSLHAEDNRFFSLLQATDIMQHRVTLQQIIDKRIDWLRTQGLKHISNYKTQLMAKKLTELGFKRHRTAKGNFWNVMLPV